MRWVRVLPLPLLLAAMLLLAAPQPALQAFAQAPAIKSIFPPRGFPGLPVAIRGEDFGNLQLPFFSTVTFNGVDAGQAINWTDGYIVVAVPEGATSGPVVVKNIWGESEPYHFTIYEEPAVFSAYFAEGTTRAGFEEWLTLYNPHDDMHTAAVTYLMAEGASRIRYYNVPAHSRLNVYVNSEIGPDRDVSLAVTAPERLFAERPMYFRYRNGWTGGHCAAPAPEASTTWFFAEGCTRPGFEEWLCLANPGAKDAAAQVTFIFADGESVTLPCTVPAWKRHTVNVNAAVGLDRDVAVRIESDEPLVAERPMYFSYRGMWDDGHITLGAAAPRETWFFAEGCTHPGFEQWLCLFNPGEEDAEVKVTYRLAGGGEVVREVLVPAERRLSVLVNSVVGPGRDVAMQVESSRPIVAERPMYFDYAGRWNGGHISMGAPAPSTSWFFAEGCTRPGFEQWLCLFNPGEEETQVEVKYAFQDGRVETQDILLAAGQRFTVHVNGLVGPYRDVAAWVHSQRGIVAERSMYFRYHDAWDGGHNTMGAVP